jgi:hypothetical protein
MRDRAKITGQAVSNFINQLGMETYEGVGIDYHTDPLIFISSYNYTVYCIILGKYISRKRDSSLIMKAENYNKVSIKR